MNTLQLHQASAAPWGAPLLRDISLALGPGRILGLTGPNGAGKSSLLRLIAGDIPLAAGHLQLAGKSREEWPRRLLARRLAYLPQLSLLNFPYTVEEVVTLGRMPHDTGLSIDAGILAQAMAATDISGLRGRLYTRLSGGEKQRVQLARVFSQVWDAGTGGLLLLDEPTTALDLAHQQMVLGAVRDLAATRLRRGAGDPRPQPGGRTGRQHRRAATGPTRGLRLAAGGIHASNCSATSLPSRY